MNRQTEQTMIAGALKELSTNNEVWYTTGRVLQYIQDSFCRKSEYASQSTHIALLQRQVVGSQLDSLVDQGKATQVLIERGSAVHPHEKAYRSVQPKA